MSNEDKAVLYDDYIFQSQQLQRDISKIKSEYAGNIPDDQQLIIDSKTKQINILVKKLEGLF